MACSSIGRPVVLTDETADRLIEILKGPVKKIDAGRPPRRPVTDEEFGRIWKRGSHEG